MGVGRITTGGWAITLVACGGIVFASGCSSNEPPAVRPAAAPVVEKQAVGMVEEPAVVAPSEWPPRRPFVVGPGEPPPVEASGWKLQEMTAETLAAKARQFVSREKWEAALPFQFYAVQKGDSGRYDLACDYARCADVEAAFYWLFEAAEKEHADAGWAEQDPDLLVLRRDARWNDVVRHLRGCESHWQTSGISKVEVIVPEGLPENEPVPLLLWLHGMGDEPHGLMGDRFYQKLANEKRIAVAGISGTIPLGPNRFKWSDDAAKNARHVETLLKQVDAKVRVAPGKIVAFGFSQGGQVAMDLAAHNPLAYAGAIVMSPGGVPFALKDVTPDGGLKGHGFVCLCGGGESPLTVRQTIACARWAESAQARVIHRPDPDQPVHSVPFDLDEKLPEWIEFVLGGESVEKQ